MPFNTHRRWGWPAPFHDLQRLQDEINRLHHDAGMAEFPPINLWTGEQGLVLMAEVPGVDPATIRRVPWATEPTAQIIHDCFHADGEPVQTTPRYVLRRVLERYRHRGWQPVIAPELEFYLVKPNTDADYPLEPPVGRSGRAEIGRQSFGIDALNEFDPLIEDIYEFCETQAIDLDTVIHESGAAQLEINLRHGEPLELADQAFLFKRTVREAAIVATCTPPSWPNQWKASREAPCTYTKA